MFNLNTLVKKKGDIYIYIHTVVFLRQSVFPLFIKNIFVYFKYNYLGIFHYLLIICIFCVKRETVFFKMLAMIIIL